MAAFDLRPFQTADVAALRRLMRDWQSVLYQLATGGGKSVVAGFIVQRLRENGFKTLILVHRRELVKQFVETLKACGLDADIGVVCPGWVATPWAPIQIGMVFSWVRRKPKFSPDMVVIDEAHHARAETWETVTGWYPKAKKLGLTATPARTDGKGLGKNAKRKKGIGFDAMHQGPTIPQLVAAHHLAPTRVLRVPIGFGRKGVRKVAGEFNAKQLDERVDERIVGNSVSAYLKHLNGMRTIMFGVSKRHARATSERLKESGVAAAYVGDDLSQGERDETMRQFGAGYYTVVCNVQLIDEGFDCPECIAVMDVAHTASVTRYLQRVGRAMRYQPRKIAILLDLVGNTYMHGLPDIARIWTLDDTDQPGAPESAADGGRKLRCCKSCFMVFRPTLTTCPQCGSEHDGRPVSEVDVELIEAEPEKPPPPKPRPKAKLTRQEVKEILYEARLMSNRGDYKGAFKHLADKGASVGYHSNWAFLMADHLKIPLEARVPGANPFDDVRA